MSEIFEQLEREASYAQRSFSERLLYQTYGAAEMARQLVALSEDEFRVLNDMTVRFMNTDHAYIQHQREAFQRIRGAGGE